MSLTARLLLGAATTLTPLAASAVGPVRQNNSAETCLTRKIADCDRAFPPDNLALTPWRGWCYLLAGSVCAADL